MRTRLVCCAALAEITAAARGGAPLPVPALASWNHLRYAPRAISSANTLLSHILNDHRLERIKSARSLPYATS